MRDLGLGINAIHRKSRLRPTRRLNAIHFTCNDQSIKSFSLQNLHFIGKTTKITTICR